ncbi:MAG: sulfite exporter TauE/SafE family protein [Pseudomonadota bacterium]
MDIAAVLLVVAFGASVHIALGMGLNLIAIPTLVLINPAYAPGPVLVVSAVITAIAMRTMPIELDRRESISVISGMLIGTAAAIALLATLDTAGFKTAIGVVIIASVALTVAGSSLPITRAMLTASGGAAGLMGTIAGIHAPPIVVQYQRASAKRLRGAILLIIVAGNIATIAALALAGRFGVDDIIAAAILAPAAAVGLWLGPKLAQRISAQQLRNAVLAISAISGALLVIA